MKNHVLIKVLLKVTRKKEKRKKKGKKEKEGKEGNKLRLSFYMAILLS